MTFDATDLALSAAVEAAGAKELVGAFVGVEYDEEERLSNYLFESNLPGYNGWRWSVTITKLDDAAPATICDVVAIPGPDALLAPKWIPYADRLQPGDVGVGDVVPSQPDDARLVPGFAALPQDEELDPTQLWELGLGRLRVLSIEGRDQAAKRWYDGERGPNAPIAKLAPKPCGSCGFFLPIAGSLRSAFGVCANAISPEDVYLAATSLPEGVTTVKPGTKLEFGVAEGRRGPQALSVRVIEAPTSLAATSRAATDDLASIIEDSIKILDRVGNNIRRGKYPTTVEAQRLGKVLRGIAQQIEDNS